MSAKKKLKYGKVRVSNADLAPGAVRRRVSVMVSERVLRDWGCIRVLSLEACIGCGYRTVNRVVGKAHACYQNGPKDSFDEKLPNRQVKLALCVDCIDGIAAANAMKITDRNG